MLSCGGRSILLASLAYGAALAQAQPELSGEHLDRHGAMMRKEPQRRPSSLVDETDSHQVEVPIHRHNHKASGAVAHKAIKSKHAKMIPSAALAKSAIEVPSRGAMHKVKRDLTKKVTKKEQSLSEDKSRTDDAEVVGTLTLDISDVDAVKAKKSDSEHALAVAITPDDVDEGDVTVNLHTDASSSFLMLRNRRMKAGKLAGSIDANYTVKCNADTKDKIVTDLNGANLTRIGERMASEFSVVGISTSVSVSQIAASLGGVGVQAQGDDDDATVDESEADAEAEGSQVHDVITGKLVLKVQDTKEFLDSGQAQSDVTKTIAEFLDVAEDDVFDEFHVLTATLAAPHQIKVDFRITVPADSTQAHITQLIKDGNSDAINKTKMEEQLRTKFEENNLDANMTVECFVEEGDETCHADSGHGGDDDDDASDDSGALGLGGASGDDDDDNKVETDAEGGPYIGEPTHAPGPKTCADFGDCIAPKPANKGHTVACPEDKLENCAFDLCCEEEDPQATATPTTTFTPMDSISGELDLQVADVDAFIGSASQQVLLDAICHQFLYATGLQDITMIACQNPVRAETDGDLVNVTEAASGTTLLEKERSRRKNMRITETEHDKFLESVKAYQTSKSHRATAGGITIAWVIDFPDTHMVHGNGTNDPVTPGIPHEILNQTLDALRTINMTDLIEAIEEDDNLAGLAMPPTEVTTLFVDEVELNIAEPPAQLVLPFGDNATSWTPEEAAAGGPPPTQAPWEMLPTCKDHPCLNGTVMKMNVSDTENPTDDACCEVPQEVAVRTQPAVAANTTPAVNTNVTTASNVTVTVNATENKTKPHAHEPAEHQHVHFFNGSGNGSEPTEAPPEVVSNNVPDENPIVNTNSTGVSGGTNATTAAATNAGAETNATTDTAETSCTAAVAVGATTIDVADTTGFELGRKITIDPDDDAKKEDNVIKAFGSIVLMNPTTKAHDIGAKIVMPAETALSASPSPTPAAASPSPTPAAATTAATATTGGATTGGATATTGDATATTGGATTGAAAATTGGATTGAATTGAATATTGGATTGSAPGGPPPSSGGGAETTTTLAGQTTTTLQGGTTEAPTEGAARQSASFGLLVQTLLIGLVTTAITTAMQ